LLRASVSLAQGHFKDSDCVRVHQPGGLLTWPLLSVGRRMGRMYTTLKSDARGIRHNQPLSTNSAMQNAGHR